MSNGQWTLSQTLAKFPGQSSTANFRLGISYLENSARPGRMFYGRDAGKIGMLQGVAGGRWSSFGDLSLNKPAGSDIAATLQFGGEIARFEQQWIVFTGTDGTLQQLPFYSASYQPPSQIVAAPNKIKGSA